MPGEHGFQLSSLGARIALQSTSPNEIYDGNKEDTIKAHTNQENQWAIKRCRFEGNYI